MDVIPKDLLTQMQLRQISEKIDVLKSEQTYLTEFTRNQAIIGPFLNARDFILSAQNAKNKVEQRYERITPLRDVWRFPQCDSIL